MTRLYNAVENGAESAPLDMRFIAKPLSRVGAVTDSVRADVVSYLSRIYESVAETLPDLRDSAFDDIDPESIPSIKPGPVDVYSIELKRQSEQNSVASGLKASKPRKKRKAVEINLERTQGETAKELKYLPPGFMKEYWVQYRELSDLQTPASFPTFWRDTWPSPSSFPFAVCCAGVRAAKSFAILGQFLLRFGCQSSRSCSSEVTTNMQSAQLVCDIVK